MRASFLNLLTGLSAGTLVLLTSCPGPSTIPPLEFSRFPNPDSALIPSLPTSAPSH